MTRSLAIGATVAVFAGLLCPTTASAALTSTTEPATLSFHGEGGNDYISQNRSWSYATPADGLKVDSTASYFRMDWLGHDGTWWYLELDTPGAQPLSPGTYEVTRYPFNGTGAGLSLWGEGRACNTLTGTYTINSVRLDGNRVAQIDADFVQHCEGGTSAALGHLSLGTPPLQLTVSNTLIGLVAKDGRAKVSGRLSCSRDATVAVTGTLSQTIKGRTTNGTYSTTANCVKGTSVEWTAVALAAGGRSFKSGSAVATSQVSAPDPSIPTSAISNATATDVDTVTLASVRSI